MCCAMLRLLAVIVALAGVLGNPVLGTGYVDPNVSLQADGATTEQVCRLPPSFQITVDHMRS